MFAHARLVTHPSLFGWHGYAVRSVDDQLPAEGQQIVGPDIGVLVWKERAVKETAIANPDVID
jgi:hypothetical protein